MLFSFVLPKGHGVSVLTHIILGLLDLGHQVSVITLSEDITKDIVIYKNKKLKIYYCPLRKRAFRFSNGLLGRAANFWYQEIKFMKQAIMRDKPDIINASRRKRIALGSGRTIQDVNRLMKQFNQMKIMIKKMKNKKSMNLPFNFG